VSGLNITTQRGWVYVYAGNGGPSGAAPFVLPASPTTRGGAGGSVVNAVVSAYGLVYVESGDGGDGTVSGGAGGAASGLKLNSSAGGIQVWGGEGGNGGTGGRGGSVFSSTLVGDDWVGVYAGVGGEGVTVGGSGGAITGVTASSNAVSPRGKGADFVGGVYLEGGNGGDATGRGTGLVSGAGGAVSSITIPVADHVMIRGGAAGGVAGAGTGGAGGSVRSINVVRVGAAVDYIVAGAGGSVAAGNGGAGGSISGVTVNGAIGYETGPFGYNNMGGLFAGPGGAGTRAGANGSVTNVRADGIAAIAVTWPGAASSVYMTDILTCTSVSNITADFVGSDLDGDGEFDYTDTDVSGTYTAGDVPLDGYVQANVVSNIRNRVGVAIVPLAVYP